MKIKTALVALVGALLVVGQAQAAVTGFTAAEGYVNGNLHDQPSGEWWCQWTTNSGLVVDTAAAGYDTNLGVVTWHSNSAYWSESVTVDDPGDTMVAKAVFRYEATGRVYSNPGNGNPTESCHLMTINFRDAVSNNHFRCTLQRTKPRTSDSNRSRMRFQVAAGGDATADAIVFDEHYEMHAGVGVTGSGQSDWLEYTASMTRGKTRLDWKLELSVKNLNTGEIILAGRWGRTGTGNMRSSADFFNAGTYDTDITAYPTANSSIADGTRQLDSYEVYAYHQDINYDLVCDGNIDGAKSKTEETSTSNVTGNWTIDTADKWSRWWGYIGGSINFCGSVGHDKFGKFGSHKDTDAATKQTGRKWMPGLGRAIVNKETIEWSVNYRMTASASPGQYPHMDLYLTANSVAADDGGDLDASYKIAYSENQVADVEETWPDEYLKMLGCRISEDGNAMAVQLKPANNYNNFQSNLVAGWIDLGDLGISGADLEGDHLKVTYRAKKTDTPPLWDCSVIILNRETGASWTFTENGLSNAALYTAAATGAIYPTIYDPNGFEVHGGGFEFDDLICRIYYTNAFDGAWEQFVARYSLAGGKEDHGDTDGLTDWGEYVFGGNPTNAADVGTQPAFDGATGNYIFSLIGDNTVAANVMTNVDLLGESWGVFDTVNVSKTNGVLSEYTNTVGTTEEKLFIKLSID